MNEAVKSGFPEVLTQIDQARRVLNEWRATILQSLFGLPDIHRDEGHIFEFFDRRSLADAETRMAYAQHQRHREKRPEGYFEARSGGCVWHYSLNGLVPSLVCYRDVPDPEEKTP